MRIRFWTLLLLVSAMCSVLSQAAALGQGIDKLPVRPKADQPSYSLSVPGTPSEALVHAQSMYVSGIGSLPDSVVGERKGVIFKYDGQVDTLTHWATGLDTPCCLAVNDSTLFVSEGNRILRFRHDTGAVYRTDTVHGAGQISDLFLTADSQLLIADPDSNAIRVLDLRNDSLYVFDLPDLRRPKSVGFYGGQVFFTEQGRDKMPGRLVTFSMDNIDKSWHVFPASERTGGYDDLLYFQEAKLFMLITPPSLTAGGQPVGGQLMVKSPFGKQAPVVLLEQVPSSTCIHVGNNEQELYMTDPERKQVRIYMQREPGNAGASR